MTNQPSPVLTAEERFVIDLLATEAEADALEDTNALGELDEDSESTEVGREHARNQMKIANVLKGLLSRTADPDTVTLPREVAERAYYRLQKDCTNWGNNPNLAGWKGTEEDRSDLILFEQALANTQAQGGDDE